MLTDVAHLAHGSACGAQGACSRVTIVTDVADVADVADVTARHLKWRVSGNRRNRRNRRNGRGPSDRCPSLTAWRRARGPRSSHFSTRTATAASPSTACRSSCAPRSLSSARVAARGLWISSRRISRLGLGLGLGLGLCGQRRQGVAAGTARGRCNGCNGAHLASHRLVASA